MSVCVCVCLCVCVCVCVCVCGCVCVRVRVRELEPHRHTAPRNQNRQLTPFFQSRALMARTKPSHAFRGRIGTANSRVGTGATHRRQNPVLTTLFSIPFTTDARGDN